MTSSKHELDAPPWQRVDSTIMAMARAIRQAYELRMTKLELNLSQASLLAFVDEWGPRTQTQIAEGLGLGRAGTGSVVDALERRGLVERQPDARDRRVWRVAATQQGRDMVKPVLEIDQVLRRELRAGISREERQQLAQLLLRLQANLASVLDADEG
ncbi:MAG: MarR family transcriptional regulator [Deltaproteobacteria bacterium]|nr:MarR family transcriptional regulator [Deltaproteobacteria bacterium]